MEDYVATKSSLREDIELAKDELEEARDNLKEGRKDVKMWKSANSPEPMTREAIEYVDSCQAEIEDIKQRIVDLKSALKEI